MPDMKAQTLRVVWFMNGQPTRQPNDLFRDVFGMEAQGSQMNQAPQPGGGAVWNVTGNDTEYAYHLQVQLGRIDINITAQAPATPPLTGAPLMSSIHQGIDRAVQIGMRASDHMLPALRVALVGEFLHPAADLDGANATLSAILGPDLIAPGSSDVVFQINRRRNLDAIPAVSMNRVLHWSVATIQTIMFAVPPTGGGMLLPGLGGPMSMQGAQLKQSYAASLRVDINSHSDTQRMYDAREQKELLREFSIELARLADANTPRALA